MRLLLETLEATSQAASTLPPIHGTLAIRTAIALTGAACCFAGDHYPLVLGRIGGAALAGGLAYSLT